MKKIGILYICTGKYDIFWKEFYTSSEKYFLNDSEIHYFVFTDAAKIYDEEYNTRIHRIYQENLGWPESTLKRFHIFLSKEWDIQKCSYLYFFNSNTVFNKSISEEEIIPSWDFHLVAALHSWYFKKKRHTFPYEKSENSTAYIPKNEWTYYFQWALQGWKTPMFIDAMREMSRNIDQDKNIQAIWHDESHWNRYLAGRNDILILSPSYIYPERSHLSIEKKIILRDKRNIPEFWLYYYQQGRWNKGILPYISSLFTKYVFSRTSTSWK